jgi:hypothetical protein
LGRGIAATVDHGDPSYVYGILRILAVRVNGCNVDRVRDGVHRGGALGISQRVCVHGVCGAVNDRKTSSAGYVDGIGRWIDCYGGEVAASGHAGSHAQRGGHGLCQSRVHHHHAYKCDCENHHQPITCSEVRHIFPPLSVAPSEQVLPCKITNSITS